MILIFYFLYTLAVISVVWGLSGTWPEFMMIIFSIFSFMGGFVLFSRFFISDDYGLLKHKECRGMLFFSIFIVIIGVIQTFFFNSEAVQLENGTGIYPTGISTFIPASINVEFFNGGATSALVLLICPIIAFFTTIQFSHNKLVARNLLRLITINIVLMGIFAIWQKSNNEYLIYGKFLSNSEKFGTFFVSNTAGVVLNLGLCGCICLAYELYTERRFTSIIEAFFWIIASFICLYASYYSRSLGALIMAFVQIAIFFVVSLVYYFGKKIFVIAIIAISITSTWAYFNFDGYENVLKNDSVSSRIMLNKVSFELFEDLPLCGYGGGSYKYRATPILIEKTKHYQFRNPISTHHAHNDVIEFILEYGIFGGVCIIGIVVLYLRLIYNQRKRLTLTNQLLLIGVFICAFHSLLDLHLHSLSAIVIFSFYAAFAISNFSNLTTKNEISI